MSMFRGSGRISAELIVVRERDRTGERKRDVISQKKSIAHGSDT